MSVFLPDRLELVKGAPALRRAHLDQFVAALWPARVATRRAYAQTLAQRNALIARIRSGAGARDSLTSWDAQLARHGIALMDDRRRRSRRSARPLPAAAPSSAWTATAPSPTGPAPRRPRAEELGPSWRSASTATSSVGSPATAPTATISSPARDGRELRAYGSQGQQRLALLALLLAEREAIARRRQAPPVMLLDDVMSELDHSRRRALVDLLRAAAGQSVITATDLEQIPGPPSRRDPARGRRRAGARGRRSAA